MKIVIIWIICMVYQTPLILNKFDTGLSDIYIYIYIYMYIQTHNIYKTTLIWLTL